MGFTDQGPEGPQLFTRPDGTPIYQRDFQGTSPLQPLASFQNGLLNSPESYQAQIMSGTDAAAPIANQTSNQEQEQNSEGGGGMPGMTAAIGNRAQKNFSQDNARLNQHAQIQGMETSNTNIGLATTNAIAEQNAQNGIQSSLNQYNLAANAARYQTVSQLMSGAGSLGGLAMAQSSQPQSQQEFNNQQGLSGSQDLTMPETGSSYGSQPGYLGGDAYSQSLNSYGSEE